MSVAYSVVLVCVYKVHRFIRQADLGPTTQELQKQIGRALIAQVSCSNSVVAMKPDDLAVNISVLRLGAAVN